MTRQERDNDRRAKRVAKRSASPATKEDCRRAIDALKEWRRPSASRTVVAMFLLAAEKRMPSAAAVDAARIRKRCGVTARQLRLAEAEDPPT